MEKKLLNEFEMMYVLLLAGGGCIYMLYLQIWREISGGIGAAPSCRGGPGRGERDGGHLAE